MFGGAGIFRDDRMFGLVTGGVIYLKTDAETVDRFKDAACRPFAFTRQGKPTETSYWSVPEAALDDPDDMLSWAELAWEAAARKAAATPSKKKKPRAAAASAPSPAPRRAGSGQGRSRGKGAASRREK